MVSIVKSIAGEDREAWGAVVGNMEKSISLVMHALGLLLPGFTHAWDE